MTAADLLVRLAELGVAITWTGDRLKVNAPTGVITPELQRELVAHRDELQALLAAPMGAAPSLPAITPRGPGAGAELSVSQERLLASIALRPDSALYNMYLAFRVEAALSAATPGAAALDEAALAASVAEIVRRHEPLRTALEPGAAAGEWRARLCDVDASAAISIVDLRDTPAPERALDAWLAAEVRRPFNLAQPPLLRASVVRLGGNVSVLAFVMHHAASDGWSWQIFLRELSALYGAAGDAQRAALPELTTSYSDFATWQRALLRDGALADQQAYWSQRLDGATGPALPLDGAARAWNDDGGARVVRQVPADVSAALQAVRARGPITPFVRLLAAYVAVLARGSGRDDIVVCTPMASRSRPEIEPLIGYFNNLVPVRVDASGDPSFIDLLERTREAVAQATDHQDVPFQSLVEMPGLASAGLSRTVFSTSDGSGSTLRLAGLRVQPIPLHNGTANFELAVTCEERGEGLVIVAEHRARPERAAAIEGLIDDYLAALARVARDPQARLSQLNVAAWRGATAHSTGAAPEGAEPVTETERALVAMWQDLFGRPVGTRDDFFALGGNSLLAARLFTRIGAELGRQLPLTALFAAPTVAQLAAAIDGRAVAGEAQLIVPIQTRGERTPFFCVHGFGGGVVDYADLARLIGEDRPFYGIQAIGQDGSVEPHARIEAMAAAYVEAMRAVQPRGPYHVGGYCYGGVVAFEMARQLEAAGERVASVLLIESYAPGCVDPKAILRPRGFANFTGNLPGWLADYTSQGGGAAARRIARRTRIAGRQVLARVSGQALVRPEDIAEDARQMPAARLHLMDVHMAASNAYQPAAPVRAPLVLLCTRSQALFTAHDPLRGWRALTTAGVEVRRVAGQHYNVLTPAYVASLAGQMREALDQADAGTNARSAASAPSTATAAA